MLRSFFCFLLLVCFCPVRVGAQVVNNLPPAPVNTSYFLYEIKFIDEFIERFNGDVDAYIKKESRRLLGSDTSLSRYKLLYTLFNKQQSWTKDTSLFIQDMIRSGRRIAFTDSDWYAEAGCLFTYNGSKITIPLILHIVPAGVGFKWIIAGIGEAPVLKDRGNAKDPGSATMSAHGDFMPTSSHGTDFIVFNSVLTPGIHAPDHFSAQLLAKPEARHFIEMLVSRNLVFDRVSNIRYHFFNIEGWYLTVERFKRKSTNTGWLISSLSKVDPGTRKKIRSVLLGN